MRYYTEVSTPIGPLTIVSNGTAITAVSMRAADTMAEKDWVRDDERLAAARLQIAEYFNGERRTFTLELAPDGTEFQQRVWATLREIPFGETRSYGELAAALGRPGSARAVGAANRTNPIGIVVPCHRVIGADGTLTGYAGGIERKRFLLDHEGASYVSTQQVEMEMPRD